MPIRKATYLDTPAIKLLLEALGYKSSLSLLINQLENLFNKEDHQVFVYELKKEVVGFISIHYLPQLGFDGELVIITYLSVDESVNYYGIGIALEQFVAEQAKIRKCDRVQVHCLDWRSKEHEFYKKQGYREYPKYYMKKLVYTD